jgi:hypothetical protein
LLEFVHQLKAAIQLNNWALVKIDNAGNATHATTPFLMPLSSAHTGCGAG